MSTALPPPEPVLRVAVARPLQKTFLYEGLQGEAPKLSVGQRLRVPFGRGEALGFFMGWEARPEGLTLKPIAEVLEETPALTEEIYALAQFAAKHYRAPLGEALKAALPPGLNVAKAAVPLRARKPKARPPIGEAATRPESLSEEQQHVLSALLHSLEAHAYEAFLLHGTTGSGKTEIYLRLVEAALSAGQGALVLVPEIALTPQLAGRFEERFGGEVALLHSGLGEGERRRHFEALRAGHAHIALGVRSAIFAPVQNLRVLIVDEEHDASFKQEEGLRYNARDLSLVRAQKAQALVLLGSATPSLESLHNVKAGKARLLRMRKRIYNRPLPDIQLVDLRSSLSPPEASPAASAPAALPPQALAPQASTPEALPPQAWPQEKGRKAPPEAVAEEEGMEVSLLTPALREALEEVLQRGQQAILFLNRRGYHRLWLCSGCGQARKCRCCDICLTYHAKARKLQCHYCGLTEGLPERCAECGGHFLKLGFGTERIEEALREAFPKARIGRLDRDTTASAKKLSGLLAGFSAGEVDILVGTQMITKGHDFHGVTLVCMLLADIGLSLPDFRASERVFHLLTQVSGRAGRGEFPGKVLVQTHHPQAEPIAYMLRGDFEGFARMEMKRRHLLAWPPYARMALIRIEGKALGEVECFARALAQEALKAMAPGTRLLGPSAAPIGRVSNKYRWQLFLKAPTYAALNGPLCALEQALRSAPKSVKVSVDVDPSTML